MNSNTLRYITIKTLWYVSMKIGQFVFLFKKRKIYDVYDLDEIIINRSDAIGDASLTKPLLILLMQYLRDLWYMGTFTLLVSEINASVFDDLDLKKVIIDEKLKIHTWNILKVTRYKIYQGIRCLFLTKNQRSNSLLIDFVWWWDMSILIYYFNMWYTSIVSCNLALWSVLLSNRTKYPFTTFQNKNLVDAYIDLIETVFDQKGTFRTYIYRHNEVFYPEFSSDRSPKEWLLVFVGCKLSRNFSLSKRIDIINYLGENFPWKVTVIDDHLNIYYTQLLEVSFPSNVTLIKNTFSLEKFKSFSESYLWIIWLDGGWMNFVRRV